jgi:primase-polymerase (primpol)-like protein
MILRENTPTCKRIAPENGVRGVVGRKAAILTGCLKPVTQPVNERGIPAAMKAARRWVCWRWVKQQAKKGGFRWTKVPINAQTGQAASSTDPATWGSFDDAFARYRAGEADGIGFVLGDGWWGFDADDCRDPETGELTELGRDVLAHVPGYAEVSPSGTGFKIIGRGPLPAGIGNRNAKTGHEVYDNGRYFAVTGQALDGRAELAELDERGAEFLRVLFPPKVKATPRSAGAPERQQPPAPAATLAPAAPPPQELDDAVSLAADEKLIDDMRASEIGDKIERLLKGDFSDYSGDESDAHLAICNAVVMRAGDDPERVLRVIGRMEVVTRHPKWGRGDYWARTIGKAIEDTKQFRPRGKRGALPSDCTDVANARRYVRDHGG